MKDLVEYMAKALVHNPDAVKVSESELDGVKVIQLEVAPEDKGRVIGKQGRVAQAMRLMVRVAAVKQGTRVTLQIL
ncbi:MAG: KH domain-containing protein [Dehalococcoidia bacterium]|nr:KH domain-containing protein [Dehalococcoidia bacterium]